MDGTRIQLCHLFTKFNYTCGVQKITKIFVLLTEERVSEVYSKTLAGRRLLVTAVHAAWIVPVMLGNVNKPFRWTVACCMYFYICRYINVCSNSARRMLQLHCVSLKKGALKSFETSFTVYPTTQRNIQEDSNLQQRRCENHQSSRSCLILLCLSSL